MRSQDSHLKFLIQRFDVVESDGQFFWRKPERPVGHTAFAVW